MNTAEIAAVVDDAIAQLAPIVRAHENNPGRTLAALTGSLNRQIVEGAEYPDPLTPAEIAEHVVEAYTVLYTGRRPDGSAPFQIPAA